MAKVKVSIAVNNSAEISEVAQKLQSAGMNVEQTLAIVGVISGEVEEDQMTAIAQIEGVKAVEPERDIQLPPPESDLQ